MLKFSTGFPQAIPQKKAGFPQAILQFTNIYDKIYYKLMISLVKLRLLEMPSQSFKLGPG